MTAVLRALVLAAVCGTALADARPDTVDAQLRSCIEHALPRKSMIQTQRVRVLSADGWQRESVRRVYWKRFPDDALKVLFVVERPPAEAGLKVLLNHRRGGDPELYVYTPDTGRARRMVGGGTSNSVLATDLTYEDAMHFESFLDDDRTRRTADGELDGVPVYVLETRPAGGTAGYALIRTYLERGTCIPVRTEFHGRGGTLDKTLVVPLDAIEEVDGYPVARRTIMYNHRYDSRTEIDITAIEVDVPLRDSLFSFAEIRRSQP